ncbi:MAG: pyrimidine-nucleoside phosphorylase, partial [Miltoncostaeaceae bacterium]|nr:pyrimidine-nucleoside phosphorylase [Miltoncostaeaceae bacterium]
MTPPLTLAPLEVIERTRRGEEVDAAGVEALVRSWIEGDASDAQMAAWCMAVCLRGLGPDGTAALTRALIASGDRLELGSLGATGDKHSTGGVGDATTLVVAPLAAALGVRVAKMSGRGLGHTGGTIDKLEAIPGFRTQLGLEGFVRQVRDVGVAVVGQDERLVPAEKRLYALRDQTATVAGAALIASSVMSKKIASGAGAVALDVKVGRGAFFADVEAGRSAAEAMAALGAGWGRQVRYLLSSMEQPLGLMVGNALEVEGAGAVLRGGGAADLRALSVGLAALLAEAAGVAGAGEGRAAAERALDSGEALESAERWVEAQGGDPAVWSQPERLPQAPLRLPVAAPRDGAVAALDALDVGEAARRLGAGRLHPDQVNDPAVGVQLLAKIGDPAAAGEPLAIVHARDRALGERAAATVLAAYRVEAGR